MLTKFNEAIARRLYDAGAPDRAIIRIMGCDTGLRAWRKREGLPALPTAGMWWERQKSQGRGPVRWEDCNKELVDDVRKEMKNGT